MVVCLALLVKEGQQFSWNIMVRRWRASLLVTSSLDVERNPEGANWEELVGFRRIMVCWLRDVVGRRAVQVVEDFCT
jgi:hypothetical protein